ncbi:MAG: transketolase, partial [Clostridia bacterium]|nr:transketolase [Clostridia bacterium]
MRDAFVRALMRLAADDRRLVLITGDLGFGVLKPFWETYPDQFVNAGIAEQAMTSMAAGLSMTGRTVITYSIGNFPTLRCLEQIRNDCAYHDANVKIVCVGGGFVYGSLGMSHHATEDIAVLRALPGVTVFAPGDPAEVEAVVPEMMKTPGTCYLRLGRGGEPTLHEAPVTGWKMPQALTLREGKDVAILSSGGILTQTVSAARMLADKGISAEVVSFPCVKP